MKTRPLTFILLMPLLSCAGAGADDAGAAPFCGDGVLDPGEVCDGSYAVDTLTCSDYGFIRGTLGCSADCLRRTTDSCVSSSDKAPACGDSVLDPGEECDGMLPPMMDCKRLGYAGGELACNASCELDRSDCSDGKSPVCGDGMVSLGEECDGNLLNGATCENIGLGGGLLSCNEGTCTFDASGCSSQKCGDGIISPSEQCDGGNLGGASCASIGYVDGVLSCDGTCNFATQGCTTSTCGDGVASGTEECDGADLDGATCKTLRFDGGTLSCSKNCTYDLSQCDQGPSCGDGSINGNEQCDGSLGGFDCTDLGYAGGSLSCNANCTFNTRSCTTAICGDGTINEDEECDGGALGGATCSSLSFAGGSLSCDRDCSFDTSGCYDVSIATDPSLSTWTPSFTPNMNGPCQPGNEDYHTLYRGRATSANANNNSATMEFKKHDDTKPSTNITYWVVVGDAMTSCLDIDNYQVRKSGTWYSSDAVLSVGGVNMWPSVAALNAAPCGESKYLFVITGGGGGLENTKVWFQKTPVRFTKVCN